MRRLALVSSLLLVVSTPLFAWYYFTASNGQRQQWVFGSSCNSGSRPITMIYDSDIQSLAAGYQTAITTVMTQWNAPTGGNLLCPTATCSPVSHQQTMTASAVNNFLNSPTANQIWMVWDTDGTVLRSVGVDPNSSVLGVGLGLNPNSSRPQDLCSGILILNAPLILSSTTPAPTIRFQQVVLHEIGHVIGLAHSIAGNNMGTVTAATGPNLPVMFPFLFSNSPTTLNPDETAGVRSIYAP
ncbi:MAG: hypothetical protein JNM27_09345 [Leptospirales bacterium]|nr:hypothetical protein [Leptospirales bacterium]